MEPKSAPALPLPAGTDREWRRWMSRLGEDFRRVRQFLGLSQAELAAQAGLSQGAVSRLESGRGLQTPFVVLVRINVALAAALRRLDPTTLTDDVRGFLSFMDYLSPPRFRGHLPESAPPVQVTQDETLERLIRRVRGMPERQRVRLMAVLEATASALEGTSEPR